MRCLGRGQQRSNLCSKYEAFKMSLTCKHLIKTNPTQIWPGGPPLTTQGHGEAFQHAACPSQREVALGVVDHRQQPPGHGCAQVSHCHVHQSVVERLPQLLVHEGHDDHCSVKHDGRTGNQGHDDGEHDEAGARQRRLFRWARVHRRIRVNRWLHARAELSASHRGASGCLTPQLPGVTWITHTQIKNKSSKSLIGTALVYPNQNRYQNSVLTKIFFKTKNVCCFLNLTKIELS